MITPTLTLIITALKKVSHSVVRDFNELEYIRSNHNSAEAFAKKSNLNCQQNLYKDLSKFKNKYSFIFEDGEVVENQDKSNYFYLNGIVGLNNFAKAIPHFGISMYLQRDNTAFSVAFYNPITSELFYAEQDKGAYYNQKRLRINENSDENQPSMAVDSEALGHIDLTKWKNLRMTNTPQLDLCYIAANKFSMGVFHKTMSKNSIDGGLLIAKESGALVKETINENRNITSLLVNCG